MCGCVDTRDCDSSQDPQWVHLQCVQVVRGQAFGSGFCFCLVSVFVFIVRVGIVRRSFLHQRLDVVSQLLGFQLKSSVCVGRDDVCLNPYRYLLSSLQVRQMEDHIRRYLSVGDDGTIRVLKIELFEDVSEYTVFKQRVAKVVNFVVFVDN
jgi:hypothetical protein